MIGKRNAEAISLSSIPCRRGPQTFNSHHKSHRLQKMTATVDKSVQCAQYLFSLLHSAASEYRLQSKMIKKGQSNMSCKILYSIVSQKTQARSPCYLGVLQASGKALHWAITSSVRVVRFTQKTSTTQKQVFISSHQGFGTIAFDKCHKSAFPNGTPKLWTSTE